MPVDRAPWLFELVPEFLGTALASPIAEALIGFIGFLVVHDPEAFAVSHPQSRALGLVEKRLVLAADLELVIPAAHGVAHPLGASEKEILYQVAAHQWIGIGNLL